MAAEFLGNNPLYSHYGQRRIYNNGCWIRDEKEEVIPEQFGIKVPQLAQQPPPPKRGILTHTVVQSPTIRFIMPLTKVEAGYRDVAYIGDNSITIRRLDASGHLSVLWESHGIKSVIRNTAAFGSNQLVLALEDDDLLFVTLLEGISHGYEPLFVRYSSPERKVADVPLGLKMATDPGSRYLAVACSSDLLLILKANPGYNSGRAPGMPKDLPQCVSSMQTISLKGSIIQMDFLHPDSEDPDLVLLAVITYYQGDSRIHLYEWDASAAHLMIDKHHNPNGYPLPPNEELPSLLVPLKARIEPGTLILVYEKHILKCLGLLGTGLRTIQIELPFPEPRSHHMTPHAPLWISWFQEWPGASIYVLVREDGVMLQVCGTLGEPFPDPLPEHAPLRCKENVVVPVSLTTDGKDFTYLLVGTETGPAPSVIYKASHGQLRVKNIFEVPNWTPLNDFVSSAATTSLKPDINQPVPFPPRIYGCSGLGNGIFLTELDRKLKASIHIAISDATSFKNVTGMWAVLRKENIRCCGVGCFYCYPDILISLTNRSILLRHLATEVESVPQEETWLDLSSRTYLASFGADVSFQVTSGGSTISETTPKLSVTAPAQETCGISTDPQERIVAAACADNHLCTLFWTPGNGCRLEIRDLNKNSSQEYPSLPLNAKIPLPQLKNPTSLGMAWIGSTLAMAMGYLGIANDVDDEGNPIVYEVGSVFIHTIGRREKDQIEEGEWDRLYRHQKYVLEPSAVPEIGDCASIAFLSLDKNPRRCLLVAGHRDGTLVVWECEVDADDVSHINRVPFHKKLGTGEVQVCADSAQPTVALINCGNAVYRLTSSGSSKFPQLTRVDLPERERETRSRIPDKMSVANYGNGFLIHRGSEIIGVELGQKLSGFLMIAWPTFSTRGDGPDVRSGLLGPATCILAPTHFGGLVVASTKAMEDGRLSPLLMGCKSGGTFIHGLLAWKPSSGSSKEKPETITSMVEISMPDPKKAGWTSILVGTSRGSLTLAYVKAGESARLAFGNVQLDGPIHALLPPPDDQGHAFVCAGTSLLLFKFPGRRDHEDAGIKSGYQLPSRGVAMNLSGCGDGKFRLNVLTAEHSVLSFDVSGVEMGESPSIVDKEERNGLDLITILDTEADGDDPHILLATDSDCTITGLYRPSGMTDGIPAAYGKLFSAELPFSIKKLRIVDTPPLWDSQADSKILFEKHILDVSTDAHQEYPSLLGIGALGSVHQIRVLREPAWQLLALLQHFASQVPEMNPVLVKGQQGVEFDPAVYRKPETLPTEIDGDLIKLWLVGRDLEKRLLEWKMPRKDGVPLALSMFEDAILKMELDWEEHGERVCAENDEGETEVDMEVVGGHIEMVYELLEWLFRPLY